MRSDETLKHEPHGHPRPRKNARPAYTPSETWPALAAFRAQRTISTGHRVVDKIAIEDARRVLASIDQRDATAGAQAFLATRRAQRAAKGEKR